MKITFSLFGIILVILTGCTFKMEFFESYAPLVERGKFNNNLLIVRNFEDLRQNKKAIIYFNSYGIPMVSYASTSEFALSLTDQFKKALKHAGYRVVDENDHGGFELTGRILEFCSKHDLITSSNIEIEITLYDGPLVLFQKIYSRNTSNYFVFDEPLPISLSQILLELIKDLNIIFNGRMYEKCEMENFSVN